MKRSGVFAGIGAAVVYLLVAAISFREGLLPVRPLYESTAPTQPYQWVNPPPALKAGNIVPRGVTKVVKITKGRSVQENLSTPEGQATVGLPSGAFQVPAGETGISVSIEPFDPTALGPPPPGTAYNGNAYRISATYQRSGEPARLKATSCPRTSESLCAPIILIFPFNANGMYRLDETVWTKLDARIVPSAPQIFIESPKLGSFVVTHLPGQTGSRRSNVIGFVLGLVALVGGTMLAARRARRSSRTRPGKGAKGAPRRGGTKRTLRLLRRWLRS